MFCPPDQTLDNPIFFPRIFQARPPFHAIESFSDYLSQAAQLIYPFGVISR